MRWGKVFTLFVIVVLIIGAAFFTAEPFKNNVKLGLDLKGGVQVRLEAKGDVTDREISQVIAIMRNRVDSLGVVEPILQKEGSNRILMELPGLESQEEAVEMIGKTAQLEFRLNDGTVVLTGKDLVDAQEVLYENIPFVTLTFGPEGTKKFAEATQELAEKYEYGDPNRAIGMYLDDELLQNPQVREAIQDGKAMIEGYKDLQDARNMALLLKSGALPVPVEVIEMRTVGPTLGADSIQKSLKAGALGIAAIFVFMLIIYRLPGVIACLSLILYAILLLAVTVLINATLTLPGIAGVLLSIGMCVDSNVIIYERLKEELRSGKSLRSAINSGFTRGFATILDSNITTLIAAAVLYFLGSGTIRGFAVTLSIGIVLSLFTSVSFTRFMLRLLADSRIASNPKFYGA
ncbi:MAG: protein translocase subunit SecD [Peptococcia bacterium]